MSTESPHPKARAVFPLLALPLLALACSSEELQRRLERATYDGDIAGVRGALDEGADPSRRIEYNLAPVTSAAYFGRLEITKLLIEAGADLDPQCRPQVICKPLSHAAEKGFVELTRLLLEAGADPDGLGPYRNVPLIHALGADQLETARLLLEFGADPNLTNQFGASPLGGICGTGLADLVPLALANGAELEARTSLGNYKNMTPLMMAAAGGHTRVVEMLLEAGADPTARSDAGETAAQLAEEAGHTGVVALLERHAP